MDASSHLDQLRAKHEALDDKIREEEKRPGADHLAVAALKKQKLHIKEEIHKLTRAN